MSIQRFLATSLDAVYPVLFDGVFRNATNR